MNELEHEFQDIEILNDIIRETKSYSKLVHQFHRELEYPLDKFLRDQMKENPIFQEKIYQYKYKLQFDKCLVELKLFTQPIIVGVVRRILKGPLWKIKDINSLRQSVVSSLSDILSKRREIIACASQVWYSEIFVLLSRHYLLHGDKFPQDLKDSFLRVRNLLLTVIETETRRLRHTVFTNARQNHQFILLADLYLKRMKHIK